MISAIRLLLSTEEPDDTPVFESAILLVSVGLLFGALTRFIQTSLKGAIPYTVVVLIIGIILGVLADHLSTLGDAAELVENVNPHFLLFAFIPGLIFESAFNTNFHIVNREFSQALLLAGISLHFLQHCFDSKLCGITS